MYYKPWMDFIRPEDMPNDDLKFVAETAGIKSAIALIFCSPGITVSVPRNAFSQVKKRYIMHEYDGTKFTINRLAVECDYSQRYIYKIIEKNLKPNIPDN